MKNWKTQTKKFLIMLLFTVAVSTPLSRLTTKLQPETEYLICSDEEEDREESGETIFKP